MPFVLDRKQGGQPLDRPLRVGEIGDHGAAPGPGGRIEVGAVQHRGEIAVEDACQLGSLVDGGRPLAALGLGDGRLLPRVGLHQVGDLLLFEARLLAGLAGPLAEFQRRVIHWHVLDCYDTYSSWDYTLLRSQGLRTGASRGIMTYAAPASANLVPGGIHVGQITASRGPEELYTIPETALRLGCSKNHVYRLIAAGVLNATDIAEEGARRTKLRVTEGSLADFLHRRTRTPGKRRAVRTAP